MSILYTCTHKEHHVGESVLGFEENWHAYQFLRFEPFSADEVQYSFTDRLHVQLRD